MAKLFVLAVTQPATSNNPSPIHWVLLIDPQKSNHLLSLTTTKPYAFDLFNNSTRLLTTPLAIISHTLLKIHIADIKSSSLTHVKQHLAHPTTATAALSLSENDWLISILDTLQSTTIIPAQQRFSSVKFLSFAHDAVVAHRSAQYEGVEEIDLVALLRRNEAVKKMLRRRSQGSEVVDEEEELRVEETARGRGKSFMGFWVPNPGVVGQKELVRHVVGAERQGDPYGGLM